MVLKFAQIKTCFIVAMKTTKFASATLLCLCYFLTKKGAKPFPVQNISTNLNL